MAAFAPDAYNIDELAGGLVAGFVAAGGFFVVARVAGQLRGKAAGRPHIAYLTTVAPPLAAVLLVIQSRVPIGLVVGVLVATVGAVVVASTARLRPRLWAEPMFGITGAAIAVATTRAEVSNALMLLLAVVTVTAALGLRALNDATPWLPSLMISISLIGIWACAADTEGILLVAGCLLPFLVATGSRRFEQRPLPAWPTAVLISTVALLGASARPPTVPGALICWGLILVIPLTVAMRPKRCPHGLTGAAPLVVAQLLIVAAASRWAARSSDMTAGMTRSVLVLVVASVAASVISMKQPGLRWPANGREPPLP